MTSPAGIVVVAVRKGLYDIRCVERLMPLEFMVRRVCSA